MTEIFKQHSRWINIVKNFGIEYYAEDVVQEAYLKCLEKESVNEAYFYLTLRSLSMNLHRKNKNIIKVSVDEINLLNDIEQPNEILEIINNFYWFDKEIFLLYHDNKFSMRKISELTGISLKTIFNTIKKCNSNIKNIWEEKLKD